MVNNKYHQTSPAKGIAAAKRSTLEVAPGIHIPLNLLTDENGDPINVDNPLRVRDSATRVYDPGNSTITTLPGDTGGEDHIYTGEWMDSMPGGSVLLIVNTDEDSAINGFTVEEIGIQSGMEVIHDHRFTVYANEEDGGHYELQLTGFKYRVKYTNGVNAQGRFIIFANYNKYGTGIHMHPSDFQFRLNHPVQLGRSLMAGMKPDNTSGNAKLSQDESLYVHLDPHALPDISVHMISMNAVTDTLAVESVKGDQTVTVTDGSQWAGGNKIKLTNDTNPEYDILTVKGIDGDDLTLDRPLDAAHDIGTELERVDVNMAIDGSETPKVFEYKPQPKKTFHIHSLHISITSTGEPALYKFGGGAALTYGVHFKVVNAVGRDETYWIPFRTLNSMELSGFNYLKEDKVGQLWSASLNLNLIDDGNVIIRLNGNVDERFTCTIRDDNTDNTTMEVKLSIHEEPTADEG